MEVNHYSLRIIYDGSDSNGAGEIVLDGTAHNLTWQTGGRECRFTVDGRDVPHGDQLEEFLNNWGDAWDTVVNKLTELGGDEDNGFYAVVRNGTVTTLISENTVLIGTLVAEK